MSWLFNDEPTPKTVALLNRLPRETALVPAMAEREGCIKPTQSDAFIADLGKLGIERNDEAPDRAFTNLLALCRTHLLTNYDAIYLDLADWRNLPLATLDDELRKRPKTKLGVPLLG